MAERKTIIIVDDDASLRRSVGNFLGSAGYATEAYESAEAFLASDRLATTSGLVLDHRMAGMSGLELLQHLAAIGVRIPVVVLTARGDDDIRRRVLEAGAVAYLTKPFRADELLAALERGISGGLPPMTPPT